MIFPETLERLDPATQDVVKQALSTLAISGIIPLQIAINKSNLLAGADNESAEELAKKILDLRLRLSLLSQFQDVCDSYYKELSHNDRA